MKKIISLVLSIFLLIPGIVYANQELVIHKAEVVEVSAGEVTISLEGGKKGQFYFEPLTGLSYQSGTALFNSFYKIPYLWSAKEEDPSFGFAVLDSNRLLVNMDLTSSGDYNIKVPVIIDSDNDEVQFIYGFASGLDENDNDSLSWGSSKVYTNRNAEVATPVETEGEKPDETEEEEVPNEITHREYFIPVEGQPLDLSYDEDGNLVINNIPENINRIWFAVTDGVVEGLTPETSEGYAGGTLYKTEWQGKTQWAPIYVHEGILENHVINKGITSATLVRGSEAWNYIDEERGVRSVMFEKGKTIAVMPIEYTREVAENGSVTETYEYLETQFVGPVPFDFDYKAQQEAPAEKPTQEKPADNNKKEETVVEIKEETTKKNSKNPQTGDAGILLSVMAFVATGGASLVISKRKYK